MIEKKISLEKYTKDTLEKHGIFLKKSLGQNFLINQNIIDRIIQVANVSKNDIVLEIGPGIGSLTRELVNHAKYVLAIEIDKRFIDILETELEQHSNYKLVNSDVLKVDLDELINSTVAELKRNGQIGENEKYNIKVVANLPYYISTPILIELIKSSKVQEIYIMLQKELAERFSAKTGVRESGSITYYISYYSDIKKEINISKNNFKPVPKVDSQVVSLKKRPYSKPVNNEELLFKLIKIGFMKRRKTFLNNMKSFEKSQNITDESLELEKIFVKLGISKTVRAEEIDLDTYIDIVNMFNML